ncbi:hypothetical protein GLOIN_2v1481556 [Rhizophagus irregularis DAOM 181602=DAOM 197198]|nr:hypothetical protein GLOIN_2v1481556 [Rhizophagus irregularis DAOM 181602=DAOM 197198]
MASGFVARLHMNCAHDPDDKLYAKYGDARVICNFIVPSSFILFLIKTIVHRLKDENRYKNDKDIGEKRVAMDSPSRSSVTWSLEWSLDEITDDPEKTKAWFEEARARGLASPLKKKEEEKKKGSGSKKKGGKKKKK